MDFHRIPAEFLRDMIIKGLIDKGIVKEEYTFESIVEMFPFDKTEQPIDENKSESEPDLEQSINEVFTDNINDDNEQSSNTVSNEDSSNTEVVDKPKKKIKKDKKDKKEKKEKKDKSDKPSKPASSFVFFKSHPDNISAIEEAAQEINEDTGKPYGKVKGAGIVWGKMSDDEKKVWADKSLEDFNSKNQVTETSS